MRNQLEGGEEPVKRDGHSPGWGRHSFEEGKNRGWMYAFSGWPVTLELDAPKRSLAVYRQGARFSGVIWFSGFGSPTLNLLSFFSVSHFSLGTVGGCSFPGQTSQPRLEVWEGWNREARRVD